MTKASIICPLCSDKVDKLLYAFHLEGERVVLEKIRQQNPEWTVSDGICSRCVDHYQTEVILQQRILPGIGPYFSIRSADDFLILPTGLRINAHQNYTGKNSTICFIDSGFYLHPDLVAHQNRVKKLVDITNESRGDGYFQQLHVSGWHGTMTSVVCAGDGYSGNGLYKGIACDAQLVLLKVQDDDGKIKPEHVERALEWVLEHYKEYNIRIVNISLGVDGEESHAKNKVALMAERLTEAGVIVVAAVGNDENGMVHAPANAPSVIAVGGINDDNKLANYTPDIYHSTFKTNLNDPLKPELVAPALWLAAPILPGTKEKQEAELLYFLLGQNDQQILERLPACFPKTQLDESILIGTDPVLIRSAIQKRVQEAKYISSAYMHVEGTSFAAPIVSSIVAQLLEINPELTPAQVRSILLGTAKRLDNVSVERQGFGAVQPRKAVLKILNRNQDILAEPSPNINKKQLSISFCVQHDCASTVALAGSFNNWNSDDYLLEPGKNGIWKIQIPMPANGLYRYKFFVDDKYWLEDVNNPYREPDGFNGFNSLFTIENN